MTYSDVEINNLNNSILVGRKSALFTNIARLLIIKISGGLLSTPYSHIFEYIKTRGAIAPHA